MTAGGPDDLTQSILGCGALIYLINSGPQAEEGKLQDIKSVALANLSGMSEHIDSPLPAFINYLLQGPLALPGPAWTLPGSREQIAGRKEGRGGGGTQEPFRGQLQQEGVGNCEAGTLKINCNPNPPVCG